MKRYKTVIMWVGIFCFSILPLMAGTIQPGSMVVSLRNTSIVSNDIIRLKDVAVMDSSTRERVGDLVIAVSPDLGKSVSIQKQEIYEKLVGNGVQSPDIQGPSRITVERKGIVVKPSFFKDHITQYIIDNSKWKDGVEVEILTSKDIVVPENDVRWELVPANGQDFFGNVLFEVKGYSRTRNEVLFSAWITARLRITHEVPVSNRSIQRNETITDSDIRWENREVTAFTKDVILERSEIVGQKAVRIIGPNTVITGSILEKRLLVRRGEMATLVAHLNGVNATTGVKALSDGAIGDTIQVINTVSKKIITAIVTGKNTLEVNVQ